MIKTQPIKRTRKTTRIANLQGSLFTFLPDEEEAASPRKSRTHNTTNRIAGVRTRRTGERESSRDSNRLTEAADHPPRYRNVIAGWSDPWREKWGLRANSLEDHGLGWRDAETQAFVEVWNQIRQNAGRDDSTF